MNEIALYSKMPDPLAAVERIGTMIAKSGMFGIDNINAGCVIALVCMSEGMSLMEYHRIYDTVLGKPRKKALASFAEFRQRGGKVKWLNDGDDGKFAQAEFKFEDQTLVHTFTMEQAQAAGLVKKDSAWQKSIGNMLRARVLSNGIAMLCPEIFAGADDDESEPAPTPTINLQPGETEIPIAHGKTAHVEVVAEIVKPVKPKGVAPHDTSKPSQQPATIPPVETHNATPNLPSDKPKLEVAGASVANPPAVSLPSKIVAQLETIIGANGPKVATWFMSQNPPWLTAGQGIEHLARNRADAIIARPKDWLNAVNRLTP